MADIPTPNLTIEDKYTVLDNTYFQVAKDDPKDRIDVEIGDSKVADDFLPQVKIMRWDNVVNASFRLIHNEANPVVTTLADKIRFVGDKIEAHFYERNSIDDITFEDGGYEFEVLLKEKPASNVLEFSMETKGLNFCYQPE